MLYDFLEKNQKEILDLTEKKSLVLAGNLQSSEQLKRGLPIFYNQLKEVLLLKGAENSNTKNDADKEKAAGDNDEPAMAKAEGRPSEIVLAKSAGDHGIELLKLGYTLSHVVHAYGAMCQSITELAIKKNENITASEFHDLNRCLDTAIAGAVTSYEEYQNLDTNKQEVEHLGFLAHELRNALTSVNFALQIIKLGTVGFAGSTGKVLDRGLKRIENLIDRSLTEVRLNASPKIIPTKEFLFQQVEQILITANIEAKYKDQKLKTDIDSSLVIEADQQLFHSALSNIIQNAIKYTPNGGTIQIRGFHEKENIVIEVEDECGGLKNPNTDLFKPYVQQNENRKGLGLGLTIAQKAMSLNHGAINVKNLPEKGCIFKITLPQEAQLQ
ncbi:MAG: HAMP domain-containing histidine kinase [Rhizobacter sp.]|nr:HAMP domain-containing histidine kinase [Bacteriovorax sp.]